MRCVIYEVDLCCPSHTFIMCVILFKQHLSLEIVRRWPKFLNNVWLLTTNLLFAQFHFYNCNEQTKHDAVMIYFEWTLELKVPFLSFCRHRRRNSWTVTRKPSQDSQLSSSRNDSASSNSTNTWRMSRSSVSSEMSSRGGAAAVAAARAAVAAQGTWFAT